MPCTILLMAITVMKTKMGNPTNMRSCAQNGGFGTCGQPESVSRGTSMLRSSFTALRYRPDVVPRRLRAAQEEDCCQVPARHKPGPRNRRPASEPVLLRLEWSWTRIRLRACARMAHQILEANRG